MTFEDEINNNGSMIVCEIIDKDAKVEIKIESNGSDDPSEDEVTRESIRFFFFVCYFYLLQKSRIVCLLRKKI